MQQARDVDLAEFLNGVGFHPANSTTKQLAHEAVRGLVGDLAVTLWQILPPGRDKSLVYTHLEDVLMRANRAIAINGGPKEHVKVEDLQELIAGQRADIPEDPRIEEYKAGQRGESAPAFDTLPFPVPDVVREQTPGDPFANRPPLG